MPTVIQEPYATSVIEVGDRIRGTDVTSGLSREGFVTLVVGPIRTPDCGGYRYHVLTDERYATGGRVTAVVYAEAVLEAAVDEAREGMVS